MHNDTKIRFYIAFVQMKNILFDDFIVKISKSARSKNIRMRVNKDGDVCLSMPKWTLQKNGLQFVQDNLDWIRAQQALRTPAKKFKDKDEINILGQPIIIVHRPQERRGCYLEDNKLVVSGDTCFLHRRVRDFIKKTAYAYIQNKAVQMANRLNEKPTRITLKDTSSRWGSCSSAKHLSFCWKLAMAPDYVLDYIIAHEVSHLKEMNHSDKFWAVVGTLGVRRADAEIWLRKHGTDLQAWE